MCERLLGVLECLWLARRWHRGWIRVWHGDWHRGLATIHWQGGSGSGTDWHVASALATGLASGLASELASGLATVTVLATMLASEENWQSGNGAIHIERRRESKPAGATSFAKALCRGWGGGGRGT